MKAGDKCPKCGGDLWGDFHTPCSDHPELMMVTPCCDRAGCGWVGDEEIPEKWIPEGCMRVVWHREQV